ncbi:glycosyltransferase family 4 protein [Simiduia agarivorans]|uniref:UDP-glucose:(Heptosyl) LPS alpha 1,3-glucosyltransferase WaaG n=1 Tax=Simiduia agarivorans (strain DSM 21679 / JCM 13881 / BCRC 17597 / SA1) TaxID=1117647 RepID=K4KL35_SIMAS|nr:glycosyltransferase family 4 protein [Simiduia agarivorans]AFU99869.1 UDP-glucose:(heptosyl) LPS alpha 1,3-glucosyltransferase WaaG [Simiduia agarivorans SA1 = DSM 21679]
MDIALTIYRYAPYEGHARHCLNIARELAARGHAVRIYSMQWVGDKPDNLRFVQVPVKSKVPEERNEFFHRWVKAHMAKFPVQLTVGFNKMAGLDVCLVTEGCYRAQVAESRNWVYKMSAAYQFWSGCEDAVFGDDSKTQILLMSGAQRAIFANQFPNAVKRMHLLPPGVTRDRKATAESELYKMGFRREHNIKSEHLVLLAVMTRFKRQGLDRLVEAVGALPDALKHRVKLWIVGNDTPDDYLRRAHELGVAERMVFFGGREDVPVFMQSADLLVHPAHQDMTATVLLEAMAAGLPVLCTTTCGYAPLVKNARGGLVASYPYSQAEFNQLLLRALESDERMEWGINALEFTDSRDIYSLAHRAADLVEAAVRDR